MEPGHLEDGPRLCRGTVRRAALSPRRRRPVLTQIIRNLTQLMQRPVWRGLRPRHGTERVMPSNQSILPHKNCVI